MKLLTEQVSARHYLQGGAAASMGAPRDCPYSDEWESKSWLAGWDDENVATD